MNKKLAATTLLGLSLLAACGTNPAPTPKPTTPTDFSSLKTLNPGQQDTINTRLKVNVVFVGYRQTLPGQVPTARQIETADFQQTLPKTYNSIARIPSAYGRTEYTGNSFDYQYNYVFADKAFEDDYFAFLKAKGKEAPLTVQQKLYNCQDDVDPKTGAPTCKTPAGNINRVIDGNFEVDANEVENWLADHVSRVGVKPGEYTVFLVNWYDRPDFKFHSYTRLDAGDTDTGTKFGARGSRRLTAWGGTVRENAAAQRVWFYDLSANPDPWTQAYDVTNSDVTGDKKADYRMPPIWEYGTRKASLGYSRKVSPDLALVTRYVALNLLFTPSPIYRVALTPPELPNDIVLDYHVEQGAKASGIDKLLNKTLSQQRLQVLQPFAKLSSSEKTTALSGDLADVYKCFIVTPEKPEDICSPNFADASGERLFQFALKELRESYKTNPGKYLLPIYLFNDDADINEGLLGIAYDDGETGTQTFVYSFLNPSLNDAGFGFTDTAVHEAGHHFSLSHPHDGYDSEEDLSYGPSGQFRFVDLGDESNSVMSYMSIQPNFSQFNLDSQYRYLTAAYLNNTNAILELARRAGKESALASTAVAADKVFAQVQGKYDALAYLDAARLAHDGYRQVLNAAKTAGVNVQPYKWYENLNGLSTSTGAKARYSSTFLPQKGAVIFPEETEQQRANRLAP
ncbi:hypothetical protein [Deinococcus fonticola]|uniref:hypothetical protein n=1 Tax=Deinococcus fonticola TaxID=2528713 RepID=UPI001074E467|nr:hypothetical protein [Deinococcus fonticola]